MARLPMPASLAALGDDDVGAGLQSVADMGDGLNLADQHRSGRLDRGKGRGSPKDNIIAPGRRTSAVEKVRLAGKRPGDEAAADPLVAGGGEFPRQPTVSP